MFKSLLIILGGLVIGISIAYIAVFQFHTLGTISSKISLPQLLEPKKQVIGFLPYWLIEKAQKDYSPYITTLTYFGLTLDGTGKIQKKVSEQENEPGWNALSTGKMDVIFSTAKKNKIALSLLVFTGDEEHIKELISQPDAHAQNLVNDIQPLMKKYSFTDLNLDIESITSASDDARLNFGEFIKHVKTQMAAKNLGTLTVEVTPFSLISKQLIDVNQIKTYADYVVLMAYDYHYQGSAVTGAVAPLGGAGAIAEFDTTTSVNQALKILPPQKLVLGIPLYGYEWETIGDTPHSAVIPGTGRVASNARVQTFLSNCATCSAKIDIEAKEKYIIYKDQETGTIHQIFSPETFSTQEKVAFSQKNKLGGIALWALGYEESSALIPLKKYH